MLLNSGYSFKHELHLVGRIREATSHCDCRSIGLDEFVTLRMGLHQKPLPAKFGLEDIGIRSLYAIWDQRPNR
jgi:hypothetical protein